MTYRPRLASAVVALPAVVGTFALLVATGLGPYTTPDSAFYVGVARSLAAGRGLMAPPGGPSLGAFPPFFGVLLGASGALGFDPLSVAGWLNPVLFGLIALGVALLTWSRSGSWVAGLVAGLAVVGSLDLLIYGGSALSEPLFMVLMLAALAALAAHLDRPGPRLLGVATAFAAAATLTRYAGVALAVTGAALLFRAGRRMEAAVFGAVSVLPAAIWLAWAGGSGRPLRFHPPGGADLLTSVRAMSRWLLPVRIPWEARVAAVLIVVALVVVAVMIGRPRRTAAMATTTAVFVTFAVVYGAAVVAYRSVLDASGRFDGRLLAPLQVVAIVLAVPAIWRRARPWPLSVGAAVLLALLLAQSAAWLARGFSDDSVARRGYSAAAWRRSPVVAAVAGLDPGAVVVTNGVDAIYLLTGRSTVTLPWERDYLSGRRDPAYPARLAALRRAGTLVAYFPVITARRSYEPSQAQLERSLPLEVVLSDRVGVLYRVVSPAG